MESTGTKTGSAIALGTDGGANWTVSTTGNVFAEDTNELSCRATADARNYFDEISLVLNGNRIGNMAPTGTVLNYDSFGSNYTWGSSADLWGASLTAANVNSSSFGFQFKCRNAFNSASIQRAIITNFSMNVPESASIQGVEGTIKGRYYGSLSSVVFIDVVKLNVYYSLESPSGLIWMVSRNGNNSLLTLN